MCIHCSHRLNYGSVCPIKPRKSRKKPLKTSNVVCENDKDDCDEMDEGDAKTSSPKLFACPNEGGIRVYRRYGSMVNHVAYGKCKFQPERESLLDAAKIMYSKKLWGGEISIKTGITGSGAAVVPSADPQITSNKATFCVSGYFSIEITLEISDFQFEVNLRLFKAKKIYLMLLDRWSFKPVIFRIYFDK